MSLRVACITLSNNFWLLKRLNYLLILYPNLVFLLFLIERDFSRENQVGLIFQSKVSPDVHIDFFYLVILQRLTFIQNNVFVLPVLLDKLWPKLDVEVSLN